MNKLIKKLGYKNLFNTIFKEKFYKTNVYLDRITGYWSYAKINREELILTDLGIMYNDVSSYVEKLLRFVDNDRIQINSPRYGIITYIGHGDFLASFYNTENIFFEDADQMIEFLKSKIKLTQFEEQNIRNNSI